MTLSHSEKRTVSAAAEESATTAAEGDAEASALPPRRSDVHAPTPERATDGGMETGTGADDEPEMAIGDRDYEGEDIHPSPEEAKRLLGGTSG